MRRAERWGRWAWHWTSSPRGTSDDSVSPARQWISSAICSLRWQRNTTSHPTFRTTFTVTFAGIRDAIRRAEAFRVLGRDLTDVRRKAEWVIAKGYRRIGAEIELVPKQAGNPNFSPGKEKLPGRSALGPPSQCWPCVC
jgi:hypothetical protein